MNRAYVLIVVEFSYWSQTRFLNCIDMLAEQPAGYEDSWLFRTVPFSLNLDAFLIFCYL